MRHWIGLGLAIALAVALFFGGGWGVARMSALPAEGLSLTSNRGLSALGALSGVGLLLGILIAAPRISPLATGLPGLVLLAWTALLGMSGTLAVKLIPLKQAPSGAGAWLRHDFPVVRALTLVGGRGRQWPRRWRRRGRAPPSAPAGRPAVAVASPLASDPRMWPWHIHQWDRTAASYPTGTGLDRGRSVRGRELLALGGAAQRDG